MKSRKQFFTLIIFIVFTNLFCWSQSKLDSVVFNIRALGMNVGTITINQETIGDKIIVEAISLVEVRIIFKIKVKYIQTSVYEHGELQESSLKTYKKGKVNSDTRLTKSENGYILDKDGEISFINDEIHYSGSLLYFNEPKNAMDLYFEISGEKTRVKSFGEHQYIIADPGNGNENEYYYKNGNLQKAVIKHSFANVYLNIKETSEDITSSN